MMEKAKAVVLGLYHVNALGTVRSLGYENIPAVGYHIEGQGDPHAAHSKYLESATIVGDEAELVESLKRFGESQDEKGVLFPTGDSYSVFCSRNLGELEEFFHVPRAPGMSLETMLDKNVNSRLGGEAGFSVPTSRYLKSYEGEVEGPVIVKPINSAVAAKSDMVVYEDSSKLLADKKKLMKKHGDMVVQQFIPGGSDNLFEVHGYNSSRGPIIGGMQRNCLGIDANYQVYGGVMFELISRPELVEPSLNLLRNVAFNGPVDINLKQSEYDGQFYFMEFNPRTSANVMLDTVAGLNLPAIAYHDLTGQDFDHLLLDEKRLGTSWLNEGALSAFFDQGGDRSKFLSSLRRLGSRGFYDSTDMAPYDNKVFRDDIAKILERINAGLGK